MGAMRQRRTEPAILGWEPRERSLQGVVKFGDSGSATGLAVPGGKPVLLGQCLADQLAGSGQRQLERQQRSTLRTALAVVTHRDPRGLVAQDDVGEGADAATRRIIGGQAAQQIDQEVLAQILALADRQAKLAPQPLRRRIGFADDGFNVVGGEFDLHRCAPRSSFLMSPRCRMRSARRWERRGNKVGGWWVWPSSAGGRAERSFAFDGWFRIPARVNCRSERYERQLWRPSFQSTQVTGGAKSNESAFCHRRARRVVSDQIVLCDLIV